MTMRYFLRTTDKDGRAYGGFQWPLEVGARVVAPDWHDDAECGAGLHGLENGESGSGYLSWENDALWWVVAVPDGVPVVDLVGKHKFPECVVVAFGDRKTVTDKMRELRPGAAVHGAYAVAGDGGTATAGDYGTATAGDYGTATAGNDGRATAGNDGRATAGNRGTATAGDGGRATAGVYGTATAGDGGRATAGVYGTATAGDGGTASAGDGGTLVLKYWCGERSRLAVNYVGENGIKPNVVYKLDNDGNFVEVK